MAVKIYQHSGILCISKLVCYDGNMAILLLVPDNIMYSLGETVWLHWMLGHIDGKDALQGYTTIVPMFMVLVQQDKNF